ncbi:hypothetical protein FisN_2Hh344 [Fistulifera solaris]|uniref:Uncharacterized protein n=1 Tax=Fistulifera solaris TaxID=1519565 RepID=A0A1Z5KK98_FISSO|nr:hypothetical protein FisN_2Hh344 [Fistulifera solaris]|eukprot:GAX26709.1 hypothetical protein FisN_2Hh344 [Fistulifera solaris]
MTLDSHSERFNSVPVTRKSFLTSLFIGGVALTASSPSTRAAESLAELKQVSDTTVQRTVQESLSGMVAGASLPVTKTLVKYPLDTATVRLQMPNSPYSIFDLPNLLKGSYRGITVPLLSNIPAGAVFFAVKDATKAVLAASSADDIPKWLSTSLAVGIAQIPYWLVRNPSEVVKTRQQAGIEGYVNTTNPWEAFTRVRADILNNRTNVPLWEGYYVGYWENILYAYPADVLKFVLYEQLAGGRPVTPAEGALVGAAATALSQFMTTPLDVVRNRLMAKTTTSETTKQSNTNYLATLVGLAQTEGLSGLFAGAVPRVGKAMISGAIQFATYEETKQSMMKLLDKRQ